MKDKNYKTINAYNVEIEKIISGEIPVGDPYETNDGYNLDVIKDDAELVFEKLASRLSDDERYWFYRYSADMNKMMELELKMQSMAYIECIQRVTMQLNICKNSSKNETCN